MTWVLLAVSLVLVAALVQQRRRTRRLDDELRRLDALGRDLATLQAARARRVADTAVALRGPLAGMSRGDPSSVAASARRMSAVVEQLREVALVDAERLPFKPSRVEPAPVVRALVASVQAEATQRGVQVEVHGLDTVQPLLADPDHLSTIVGSLLVNAVRFTRRGGTVRVRATQEPDGLSLEVQDEGPGIPVEVQQHLFDGRAVGHVLREQHSSGLSLAIARELADLHGGRLTLHSVVGRGSTFRLHLREQLPVGLVVQDRKPAVRPEGGVAQLKKQAVLAELHRDAAAATVPLDAPRVLVVEDNADLREFLLGHLGRRYHVQGVADGQEALDAARRVAPDLILADVLMPRMDGYALVREVRSDPVLQRVPVLLVSGRTEVSAIVEGLEAGADGHLTKPFQLQELEAWLASMLRGSAAENRLAERDSRLAAVGMMASSLAHDVRNPLAIVHSVSELARDTAREAGHAELVEDLDTILSESHRIRRLLTELTAFAGGRALEQALEPQPLGPWLEGVAQPLATALGDCRLDFRDDSQGAQVAMHPDSLQRAVENLVRNARDAGANRIRVVAHPDGFLVSDDGPGIPAERIQALFEPFVTEGKADGTGLGLAIVQNTVRRHGGRIEVDGRGPDGGAAFRVHLG